MKSKIILSGITALGLACSMCSGIVSEAEVTEYKISDLVGLVHYILDGTSKIDKSRMDINSDGEINLADIIWMKSVILGDSDINAKIYDVQKLNEDALKLYEYAQRIVYTAEIEGQYLRNGIYSSDKNESNNSNDGEKYFYQKISDMAQKNNIKKWAFIVEDYKISSVVTSCEDLLASGAYPNMIPQKYNVPYNINGKLSDRNVDLFQYASNDEYSMSVDLSSYISANPKQSSLPDYSLNTILKLRNDYAKTTFNNLQILSNEYKSKGIEVSGRFGDDGYNDFINEYNKKYGNGFIKWEAIIDNNVVKGVKSQYMNDQYCGTYPNMIPQKYNIPFDQTSQPFDSRIDLVKYACDDEYYMSVDLNCFASSDPEQVSLPDYSLDTILKLRNDYAKTTFNNLQILSNEYKSNGIEVSGRFGDDGNNDFINEYNKKYGNGFIKWEAIIENNVVKGVESKYMNDQYCGTYPNMIPQKYNIPFDQTSQPFDSRIDLVKYACDDEYYMSVDLNSFASSDPEQALLADYSVDTLLKLRNDYAKTTFTNLQSLAQEYESKGIEVSGRFGNDCPSQAKL